MLQGQDRVKQLIKLIDGKENTSFATGSENPWVRIDLGLNPCKIVKIQIIKRTSIEKSGYLNVNKKLIQICYFDKIKFYFR